MAAGGQIHILDEDVVELTNSTQIEKPQEKDSTLQPVLIRNSSSDENEGTEPVVKRKRATCRRRKQVQRAPEMKENDSHSGIYGNVIDECYKKIQSGLQSKTAERLLSDEENEDLNNNNNNDNSHVPRNKRRHVADYAHKRTSPRKTIQEQELLLSPVHAEPDVITVRDRSPSPPPSPAPWTEQLVTGRRRGPRRPKAVTKALAEIQAFERTMSRLNEYRANTSLGDCSLDGSLIEDVGGAAQEIVVKIRNRSGIERFSMKSTESFLDVFETMAAKEGVPSDQCMMFRDDDTIEPYMTPASARVTVADILFFCVRAKEDVGDISNDSDDPDCIQLQVQATGLKRKTKVSLLRTEPLLKLMMEFARQHDRDVSTIKFFFDGDLVKPSDTPGDHDMEEMECLDAVFL